MKPREDHKADFIRQSKLKQREQVIPPLSRQNDERTEQHDEQAQRHRRGGGDAPGRHERKGAEAQQRLAAAVEDALQQKEHCEHAERAAHAPERAAEMHPAEQQYQRRERQQQREQRQVHRRDGRRGEREQHRELHPRIERFQLHPSTCSLSAYFSMNARSWLTKMTPLPAAATSVSSPPSSSRARISKLAVGSSSRT